MLAAPPDPHRLPPALALLVASVTALATPAPPAASAPAPPPERCLERITGDSDRGASRLLRLADDRIIGLGGIGTGADSDAWILRLAEDGTILREIALGGADEDTLRRVAPRSDGGLLVLAESRSFADGEERPWVVALDASLEIEWQTVIDTPGTDPFGTGIVELGSGDVLAVFDVRMDRGLRDAFVVVLDPVGSLVRAERLGLPGDDVMGHLAPTADGGAVGIGSSATLAPGRSDLDAWVLRFDGLGLVAWERRLGGEGFDVGNFVLESEDGDLSIAGYSFGAMSLAQDAWVARLDPTGTPRWWVRLEGEGSDIGGLLRRLEDDSLLVTISVRDAGPDSDRDTLIAALSPEGELLWTRGLGDDGHELFGPPLPTAAGAHLALGGQVEADPVDPLITTLLARLGPMAELTGDCLARDLEITRRDAIPPFSPGATPRLAPGVSLLPADGRVVSTISDVTLLCASPPTIECPDDVTIGTGPDDDDCRVPFDPEPAEAAAACAQAVELSHDAPAELPLGTTTVTHVATDELGQQASCEQRVTVVDDTPPRLEVSVEPSCLWAPNHRWVELALGTHVEATVTDNCDPDPSVAIVACASNEPADGEGDGAFAPDCVIEGDVVRLRAERSGLGDGRRYAITIRASDDAGNVAEAAVVVRVAHDQREHDCPRWEGGGEPGSEDGRP